MAVQSWQRSKVYAWKGEDGEWRVRGDSQDVNEFKTRAEGLRASMASAIRF
jgi:hypothetical protein